MPKLPDIMDMGGRPVPVSRAAIVSNPGAGAVGDALAGLGQTMFGIGRQGIEKEDRLAYAAARTAILKADVQARADLDSETDWTKHESIYADRMKAARESARGLIRSKSDAAQFDVDVDADLTRGSAEVAKGVLVKRNASRLATAETALDELYDTSLSATDDATRTSAITTANEIIDAAEKEGVIDPIEAGRRRRVWANDYASQQIQSRLLAEDVDGAAHVYEQSVGMLDQRTAISLASDIKRIKDGRLAASDAMRLASETGYSAPKEGNNSGWFSTIVSIEGGTGKDGRFLTSPKGAVGPSQVMPDTAPEAARLAGLKWDEKRYRTDRDYNLALGEAYYKAQLRTFGDPVKAAAAYNAGPGSAAKGTGVRGAMAKAQADGRPDDWEQFLPAETRNYVQNFRKKAGGPEQSARRWDKEAWYASIDKTADAEGWTFERRERAKGYADNQIARDEQLFARRENDADRSASELIIGMRDRFTDVSQIPVSVRRNMSPQALNSAMNVAAANSEPREPEANGMTVMGLHALQYSDPNGFMNIDLSQFVGKVTRAEMDGLVSTKAQLIGQGGPKLVSARSNISAEIGRRTSMDRDLKEALDPRTKPGNFARLAGSMEAYIKNATEGKRDPTDKELDAAFSFATRGVFVDGGWLGGDDRKPAYAVDPTRDKVKASSVPRDAYDRIVGAFLLRYGRKPDEGTIARMYRENAGKPGAGF